MSTSTLITNNDEHTNLVQSTFRGENSKISVREIRSMQTVELGCSNLSYDVLDMVGVRHLSKRDAQVSSSSHGVTRLYRTSHRLSHQVSQHDSNSFYHIY